MLNHDCHWHDDIWDSIFSYVQFEKIGGWMVKSVFFVHISAKKVYVVYFTLSFCLIDLLFFFSFLFHQDSLNWVYIAHDFFYDTVTYPESWPWAFGPGPFLVVNYVKTFSTLNFLSLWAKMYLFWRLIRAWILVGNHVIGIAVKLYITYVMNKFLILLSSCFCFIFFIFFFTNVDMDLLKLFCSYRIRVLA